MKILLVTSEVTFVPENYNQFLNGVFQGIEAHADLKVELVILKNNSPMLLMKGVALALMGARHIGYHLFKNSIKAFFKDRTTLAQNYNIPLHFFTNPNSPDFLEFVKNHQTDLLVNARTRFIYKSKILKQPKLGSINIHHGLLPDYRGTMCDLWALLADRPTGFSIHIMEKKIDDGAIVRLVQTTNPSELDKRKSFSTLIFESSKTEGIEMSKMLIEINKKQIIPIEQANISKNPSYTKNPDFKAIRNMLSKGIEL